MLFFKKTALLMQTGYRPLAKMKQKILLCVCAGHKNRRE